MEEQLEEASAELESCLIPYHKISEQIQSKKGNPGNDKGSVDLDSKISEVREALSDDRSLELLTIDEKFERILFFFMYSLII